MKKILSLYLKTPWGYVENAEIQFWNEKKWMRGWHLKTVGLDEFCIYIYLIRKVSFAVHKQTLAELKKWEWRRHPSSPMGVGGFLTVEVFLHSLGGLLLFYFERASTIQVWSFSFFFVFLINIFLIPSPY